MKRKALILFLFSAFIFSSCARVPKEKPYEPAKPRMPRASITHEVAPGETLWRISKLYDVDINDITSANNIKDATKIEKGQRIIVPGAAPIDQFIPLYKNNEWKYIIIHHSATEIGNALKFYDSHKRRGFINGLGYHFLIDNGTSGKADGQLELSPRWIKQQSGAHCKAGSMNNRGIGICLVGNLSDRRPSEAQIQTLSALVNTLRKYYNIPLSNIIGHGQVKGASTECPGKLFPWKEFKERLRQEIRMKSVEGRRG